MEKAECTRIEWLAQFDDYALASMANEGYRLEDDSLETCTLEELQAVKDYRAERFNKWAETNPFAEIETMVQGATIVEIVFRVYGGTSHSERLEVAMDYISSLNSEGQLVSCDRYETTAKKDGEGNSYVEFRFTCS
jgi:hypothetical protein